MIWLFLEEGWSSGLHAPTHTHTTTPTFRCLCGGRPLTPKHALPRLEKKKAAASAAGELAMERAAARTAAILAPPKEAATAASILAHLHVDIAAFVTPGWWPDIRHTAPPHLGTVLACVASYRVLRSAGLVRSMSLAIHTNNEEAIAPLAARLRAHGFGGDPKWVARVQPWDAKLAAAGGRANNFMLAHAHLHRWSRLVADANSNATAFVHLEDDVCPRVESLVAWAEDEALLRNSGASAAGFQRGFYRFEVTRPSHEMPPPGPKSKYTREYIARRARTWRATHNISYGERFVLDERLHRKYSPVYGRKCDDTPCDARPSAMASSNRTAGANLNANLGANVSDAHAAGALTRAGRPRFGWCAEYPTVAVHDSQPSAQVSGSAAPHVRANYSSSPTSSMLPGGGRDRVFTSLANPYSAITAASRPLVESFLLHSTGWRMDSDSSLRLRHKAYAVREYGSCTFHYANEFIKFADAPPGVIWPMGLFGSTAKVAGGMRRVLVPLVLSPNAKRANGRALAGGSNSATWQIDPVAGVHHMSDRVVNGPRKGSNEQFSGRHHEDEVMRCAPTQKVRAGAGDVPRGVLLLNRGVPQRGKSARRGGSAAARGMAKRAARPRTVIAATVVGTLVS